MRRELLIGCVLIALVWGIYWPARHFDFIYYDDPQFITENAQIQNGLTAEGLRYALTRPVVGNWHPVTTLSHMADCQLFGANPGAHHLVNVFFHGLNAALLFWLLRALTGGTWRSALVAALFAVHPLRVESVAWISERKDLISGFFFLLTLFAYGRFARVKGASGATSPGKAAAAIWYGIALFAFLLALMSKPMVVTLPFVLLLIDIWPLGRVEGKLRQPGAWLRLVGEKAPFFVLSASVSVLTYLIQKQAGAMTLMESTTLWQRTANAAASYLKYLGKGIWPANLAAVYPHPSRHYFINDNWAAWQTLAAILVLALVSALCLLRLKKQPWLAVGWFWFLGMLVPVIGLVQVGEQAMADRYTYLPLIGPVLACVWSAGAWLSENSNRIIRPAILKTAVAGAGIVVFAFTGLSVKQLGYWRDTLILFEHAAAVTTDNPSAQFAIGVALDKTGRIPEAMVQYRIALAIDPSAPKPHYNLGQLLRNQNRWAEAAAQYEATLRCSPNDVPAHLNLAGVLQELSRTREAMEQFETALRLDPGSTEALNNLAWLLATRPEPELRNGPRAVQLAEKACALSEFKQAVMIGTLAAAYAEAGRFAEAISTGERALETAASQGQHDVAARNRELLSLYRQGKRCRAPALETN